MDLWVIKGLIFLGLLKKGQPCKATMEGVKKKKKKKKRKKRERESYRWNKRKGNRVRNIFIQ